MDAKSFLLQFLSAAPGNALQVQALVRGGLILGLNESALRVALSRLRTGELVRQQSRGVYQLGKGAQAIQREVGAWRATLDQLVPWEGPYLAVHTGALSRTDRTGLRARQRALRLLGFEELQSGLAVRPDNLRGGLVAARKRLHDLGLQRDAPVFHLTGLDAVTERRARGLWARRKLNRAYADGASRLQSVERSLSRMSFERAARATFEAGSTAIRQIVFDPLLPEPIVDAEARRTFVEAMRRFDDLGHAFWSRVMSSEPTIRSKDVLALWKERSAA